MSADVEELEQFLESVLSDAGFSTPDREHPHVADSMPPPTRSPSSILRGVSEPARPFPSLAESTSEPAPPTRRSSDAQRLAAPPLQSQESRLRLSSAPAGAIRMMRKQSAQVLARTTAPSGSLLGLHRQSDV
jgi:hypothetical protein